MVKYLYIFLVSLFLFPAVSSAQEVSFEAYIDRESVSAGETFQVKLELINAQAQTAPDLSVLPAELSVLGQQQQANITVLNGVQVQNLSWVLDMTCDKEGTYKIPSIPIKTNMGDLSTRPFKIFVKPSSQISANTSDNSVFIDVQVEKMDPFIDEPVLYKTIVYYLGETQSAELVKPKAENAIVEQISEAKPSRQILNGVNYKVIEVDYIITPVRTGDVVIEPSVLRGKISKDIQQARTPMDDLFAPFGGMAQIVREFIPFTVASKPVTLNVSPADTNVNPWLVLYDMQIDDELGDVEYDQINNRILAKAGEPISRRIRITAYGKGGESLPEIENSFTSTDFKIYSDKAEFTKEVESGEGSIVSRIKGTRIQTFTFIPQKTGMLTLPELNIPYWSLKENKIVKANLPGKVITAVPSENSAAETQPKPKAARPVIAQPEEQQPSEPQSLESKLEQITNSPQMPNLVLLMLSFFICVVVFIAFKVITSSKVNKQEFDEDLINKAKPEKTKSVKGQGPASRKIINFSSKGKTEPQGDSDIIILINNAQNHEELQQALQKFAVRNLSVSQNSGTVIIANAMANKYKIDKQVAMKYAAELDSVLYAGKQIDLEYLKNGFAELISQAEANMNTSSEKKDDDKLISLNP